MSQLGLWQDLTEVGRADFVSFQFRRDLLDGDSPDIPNANQLIRAILQFMTQANTQLRTQTGRPLLGQFGLIRSRIATIIGRQKPFNGRVCFGDFEGKWYGQWTDFNVDHHWQSVQQLDNPGQITVDGQIFRVHAYQYAWVGDGYGLNLVVEIADKQPRYCILGYVVHIKDRDFRQVLSRRPHVGVFVEKGKLIWITASEVFFEQTLKFDNQPAYAITGFRYAVQDDTLVATKGFQAIYTRSPDRRPEFFEFPVSLSLKAK